MANILFVNSSETHCGVHQFGKRSYEIIQESQKYLFPYVTSLEMFWPTYEQYKPAAVIFNYYPITMPWVNHSFLAKISVPTFALYHEIELTGFNYYIHLDPTFFEQDNHFTTGRPLFEYHKTWTLPTIPVIGSFGFGFGNKGFEKIVRQVQEEFDEAIIRFHIPFAKFGDENGLSAKTIANNCRELIHKPAIRIEISHHFMDDNDLLDFLAQNTINCFFFDNMYGRGISSSTDYALSVKRPIAITNNWMHRHLRNAVPTITTDNASLKWIIANGNKPLEPYQRLWSNENLIKDYERILSNVLQ